jgi:hypothetical protein
MVFSLQSAAKLMQISELTKKKMGEGNELNE